jgi:hypothetical protein
MERFLPGRRISEIHGEPRLKNGKVYLPVYHPAAALYNGGLRETVFADFAQIPGLVERVQETGRDGLLARSGVVSGGPEGISLGGSGDEDVAAEFSDASEVAASAPSPASFSADYADPLEGMEAARMIPPPREVPVETGDEPPRPGPGQAGLF